MISIRTFMNTLVKNFNPIWFVSIMGTGITSSILYNFPYEAYWLKIMGLIMFGINSILLLSITILFILNIIIYKTGKDFLLNLQKSVFLGCYAMGFTSWCNMLYYILENRCMILIYTLWWIGNIMSLFTSWIVFFIIIKSNKLSLDKISTTLLLPVVPLTVVASSGGIFYKDLPEILQPSTLIITYLLWANSMVVSFIITTIYTYKLLIHKLPTQQAIFTSFIPIGFMGQGAYAIQLFGENFHHSQTLKSSTSESQMIAISIKYICILIAMFLETFGFFMTFIALVSVLSYTKGLKFHKGWWAMTFPLGTMSISTNLTSKLMDYETFRVISMCYGVSLIFITCGCLIGSLIYELPNLHEQVQENDISNLEDLENGTLYDK